MFRNAYTPVKTFFKKKKKNSKEIISMKVRKAVVEHVGDKSTWGFLCLGSALFLKLYSEDIDALFYYCSLNCISAFYVLL